MKKCGSCGSVVSADEMCPACGARLGPPTGGLAVPHHATPPDAPSLPPPYVSPARLSAANEATPAGGATSWTQSSTDGGDLCGMRRCPSGHQLPSGSRFCAECGLPIDAPPTAPGPTVSEPTSPTRKRRKTPFVILGALLVIAITGAGGWWFTRPSTEARYIEALDQADARSEFPTDRAAVLHAESVCEAFDASGDPKGGVAESAAVEFYCPQWEKGFRVLETVTVTGTFDVSDVDEYYSARDGAACEGEGGYGDINANTQVILTDGAGDVITRTELGPGEIQDYSCHYEYSFEVTEGEDLYVVAVGDRGESSYSFDDLKAGLALSLG